MYKIFIPYKFILVPAMLWLVAISAVLSQGFDASVVFDPAGGGLKPEGITAAGGKIYYSGDMGYPIGRRLFVFDENTGSTVYIEACEDPHTFVEAGSKVFFFAEGFGTGTELWASDGTAGGTYLVKEIRPGGIGIFGTYDDHVMVEFRGKVLFNANNGLDGGELWVSDGTPSGTQMVKNIRTTPEEGSDISNFFVWNAIAYFSAEDSWDNDELWRSDGTAAGTYQVIDIDNDGGSGPSQFTPLGGYLLFTAQHDDYGQDELWRTDGTTAGTVIVKDIRPGGLNISADVSWLTKIGNVVYFAANEYATYGKELWRTDGTPVGTWMVKDIRSGANDSDPRFLTAVGSTLYFVAEDGQNKRQLWKSNGQLGNATMVHHVPLFYGTGTTDTDPLDLVEFKGRLLFKMRYAFPEGSVYYEWFEANSTGQISLIKDIGPGGNAGVLFYDWQDRSIAKTGSALYFQGNDYAGYNNAELWRISQTLAITSQPMPVILLEGGSGSLAFSTDHSLLNVQWHRNNVTLQGAQAATLPLTNATTNFTPGNYYASCSSATGVASTATVQVAVIKSSSLPVGMKEGGTLKLSVRVYGEDVSYQWKRNGASLSDDNRISGSRGPILTIRGFMESEVGDFLCAVSIPGATRNSLIQTVSIVTKPVLSNTPPPVSYVGGELVWQLGASQAPSSYLVRGLPVGLRYDPVTGRVYGKPNRPGNYQVRVIAKNVAGASDPKEFTMIVGEFPDGLAGNYFGELDRNLVLNSDLGGSISARVNAIGLISGHLNLGGRILRFKGRLEAKQVGSSSASIEIPVRREAPYLVSFTFDSTLRKVNGTVARNGSSATFRAHGNPWNRMAPNLFYSGQYNSGLDLESARHGILAFPQGHGYMIKRVSSSGIVRIVGRAGDGAKFSMGGIVSRSGEVPIFILMHKKQASFCGVQTITAAGLAPNFSDSTVAGGLTWLKRPNSVGKGISYPDGIALSNVATLGGKWTPPPLGELILGAPSDGTENVRFLLRYGTMPSVNPRFILSSQHRAIFDGSSNTYRMSATFSPSSGFFRGQFYKTDDDPMRPGKLLTRKATYSGIVVPQRNFGYGFFTISELPVMGGPKPKYLSGAITVDEL